jgi:hypothetical protein
MEQRAKVMGKASAASVYRSFINSMKEKTKEMQEDWSNKYKKSIDCNNPKGFSQKAHCQARKLRSMGKKTESKPVNEARIDKHEVSGKVVIDGHVFSDAGKSGRSTYGRYSVKDPNYVKDSKEIGMHRNYRKPSTINFDTLAKAKSWVKTQPKKSKEEIDRVHKKHADFEKMMNESTQFAIQGHQVHADSNGMKIYHGGELVHHIKGDFTNPNKMDRARVQRYVTNKIESSPEYKAKRDSLLRKEDAPVNVVGGGQVAGLGVGDQGEPGVSPKKRKKVIPFKTFLRKPPQ